ncbi:prephenate dehydrogenase [Nonlabens tegetincola]|uniref:prephenate dehydrogenase n=1 Tax=Nonlabens tegetincola TaxID=323273 RepID=UPI0030C8C516
MINKIAVIGVGLIGGSIVRDCKKKWPNLECTGIDINPKNISKAVELGWVDKQGSINDLQNMDVVIISIPVNAIENELKDILDCISPNTLVMDTGSTKNAICKSVENHKNRHQFLAAHPIAGTEYSGPDAALEGLFIDKTMIVCEIEKTQFKLQNRAKEIFEILKCKVRYMTPLAHDKHIAYVSHLSHISSFMLGKTVMQEEESERDIFDLAGSGFESTVRLAKSSPAMWTAIFSQNKEHVIASLDRYVENLSRFRESIINNDTTTMYKELESTNRIKNILEGIKNGE